MNLKVKRNVRNLSYHLIKRGRIRTSLSLAKEIRKNVERLITRSKKDSLASRRYVAKKLPPDGVNRLFKVIAPANVNRSSGYTRTLRIGKRMGDSRKMCILEIIDV